VNAIRIAVPLLALTALLGAAAAAPPPVALDPSRGSEIGASYEAYLSPWQESDEEANTPSTVPSMFRSSAPSLSRADREAQGHRGQGVVRFSKDLSRAWVDVKIAGVKVEDINMFHIHCGKPGILGPILVDFSLMTDIQKNFSDDGVFSVEITDKSITGTVKSGHDMTGAFTLGCLVNSGSLDAGKPPKVSTVAGMADLASTGDLYFNLHTKGQTYYGDIRGQLHAATP
jgi:hypothetical protein